MKRASAVTAVLLALSFAAFETIAAAQTTAGWTTVLDGSSLKGWNLVGNANWTVKDGAVQADSGAGFLVTPISYADFELKAEIWVSDDANSGIFIRCQDPKAIGGSSAYEVNIYDKRPDPKYRTGAIVNVAEPASMINAGSRWNTLEISARGSRLMVTLNGTRTVDVQDNKYAKGFIALQASAGVVKFRNVQIRAL